jgi:hypothetical protein
LELEQQNSTLENNEDSTMDADDVERNLSAGT